MGEPAVPTERERQQRRALAQQIIERSRDDLASPLLVDALLLLENIEEKAKGVRHAMEHMDDQAFGLAQEVLMLFDTLMEATRDQRAVPFTDRTTDKTIDNALALCDKASKGPASWVEPATGVDDAGKRNAPSQMFITMLRDGELAERSECAGISGEGLGYAKVHGVSVKTRQGGIVGDGDEHFVIAITGNGPTSDANARMIAAAFHPEHGYESVLRQLRAARSALASVELLAHGDVSDASEVFERAVDIAKEALR